MTLMPIIMLSALSVLLHFYFLLNFLDRIHVFVFERVTPATCCRGHPTQNMRLGRPFQKVEFLSLAAVLRSRKWSFISINAYSPEYWNMITEN